MNICNPTYFQVSKHSKRDDLLLSKPRTAILYDLNTTLKRPKQSLRILTNYHEYLRKPKGTG